VRLPWELSARRTIRGRQNVPPRARFTRSLQVAAAGDDAVPMAAGHIDPETGLPDGSALLEALTADPRAVRALELLSVRDPDGLDEPLILDPLRGRELGQAVRDAAAWRAGQAFRLGGSVYALLGPADPASGRLVAGLHVLPGGTHGITHSRVTVPDESLPGRPALRLAYERLRAAAARHPLAPGRQACDVVLALLAERRIPTGRVGRRPEVAAHAVGIGRRLRLGTRELDDLVRAAELQDVGMLRLDAALLDKQAPLDDDDWAAIREHPIAGERVLAAAPSLRSVARIVRSCYERWDGGGYPDGLTGEAIPLSARIIAASVAYDAMTSRRAYRSPFTHEEARLELIRCAGAQFDPRVVAEFLAVLAGARARPLAGVA
jgi:hypothetical protein